MPNNSIQCGECGQPLEAHRQGACPWCGSTKRHFNVLDPHIDEKVGERKIVAFFKNNALRLAGVIALTAISSVVGLAVSGFTGFVIGLILSVVSLIVGFYVRTLMRGKTPMR
jgi:hypothetical protein